MSQFAYRRHSFAPSTSQPCSSGVPSPPLGGNILCARIGRLELSAPRRPSLACGSYSHNLQPWQLERLEQAYEAGKRNIRINDLSKEVGLDRGSVLQWFKEHEALPDRVRGSLRDARHKALEADQQRKALLKDSKATKVAHKGQADQKEEMPLAERQRLYYTQKRVAWDVEATFEKVYQHSSRGWPTDEMVLSLVELYRMPRKKVLNWFADRRKQDPELQLQHQQRQQQRRGGGPQPERKPQRQGAPQAQGGPGGAAMVVDAELPDQDTHVA